MLYITVNEKSGLLVKIYRCLHQANYKISSHHLTPHPSEGVMLVEIVVSEGELPVSFNLESQLLNIDGCLDIFYEPPSWDAEEEGAQITAAKTISEGVKTKIKDTAEFILNDMNNIGNFVSDFRNKCEDSSVASCLYELGVEVGSGLYQIEYALGKPLKLEPAIKRVLADATKKFGKTTSTKKTLTIEDNIFCNVRNADGDCDFTRGYITGLLRSSPTTSNVKIQRNSCRSHGQFSCSFEFQ